MSIPKFSVNRPVTISMIFLAVLILGGISFSLLKIEMLPRIPIPKIVVETKYQNAAPEEVEELVTKPLEETLSTLEGLKKISSISSTGKSIIIMEFYWQIDIDFATLKAREKLDRIKWSLPEEVSRPNILNFDPAEKPIISYAITGSDDLYLLSQIGKNLLKRRFEQLSGVAKAELSGIVDEEIVIQVSPQKLFLYNITPDMISRKVKELNATYAGGELIDGWYKYSVLFPKNLQNVDDIKNISIRNPNGNEFLLKELGKVYAQPQLRESIAKVNGKEGVILNIIKNSDANTVEVCKLVRKSAEKWNTQEGTSSPKDLPLVERRIKLELLYDDSRIVINAINSVVQAILIGGVLAFFVLMLFLKGIKSPIAIAISMPFSIIAAFIMLYFSRISLNILSMGGLAIGIGLLVDNAIIVLENITRHKENGVKLKDSCINGTEEVMLSISAGTFTTIAVFFPIIYLQGVSAVFFKEQALTITFALLASLAIAVTFVPSFFNKKLSKLSSSPPKIFRAIRNDGSKQSIHKTTRRSLRVVLLPFYFIWRIILSIKEIIKFILKFILYGIQFLINRILVSFVSTINKLIKPMGEWNERFWLKVKAKYEKLLNNALKKKELTIIITVAIFIITLFMARFVPRRFIPELTPDKLNVVIEQPSGTPLNITQKKMEVLEKYLLGLKEISNVESFIGEEHTEAGFITYKKNAAHKGYFVLSLEPGEIGNISRFKSKLNEELNKMIDGDISVLSAGSVYQNIFYFGDYPYEINIYGNNLDELVRNTNLVQEQLDKLSSQRKMFSEVRSNLEITKPTFRLSFNENVLRTYQLSKYEVTKKLQEFNFGYKIDELVYGNELKDIVLRTYERTPEKRNLNLSEFMKQKLILNDHMFNVSELISVERYLSPEEIYHQKQQRTATIFIKLNKDVKYQTGLENIQKTLRLLSNKYNFKYDITGESERIKENFGGLIFAFILAIILVYMILGVQFESFFLPFVIILTIPLASIGVIWGLLITGISINLMSLIGTVVLVGIVVNDSIVKLDTIKRLRKQGYDLLTAVKMGGSQRFRPIIMTSLTTIFGLLPLAIGLGSGAELTQPLAVTVISGLIASTFLTLFVIPVIYVLFEKRNIQPRINPARLGAQTG